MKVSVYTIVWNEETILPYFLRHYHWADRIVIFDNQSTDRTPDIARADPRVTLHTYGTGNEQHNRVMREIKNTCWKGDDADWVIVVDADEFFDPGDLLERHCGERAVFRPAGLQMIGTWEPVDKITRFVLAPKYDKQCCFNPRIEDINYNYGAHICHPAGHTAVIDGGLLRHYAFLSEDYVLDRWRKYAARISRFDASLQIGAEYQADEGRIRHWYRQCVAASANPNYTLGPRLRDYLRTGNGKRVDTHVAHPVSAGPGSILAVVTNWEFSVNADRMKKRLSRFFPTLIVDSSSSVSPKHVDITIPNTYYPGLWNAAVRAALDAKVDWLLFAASDLCIPDVPLFATRIIEATQDATIGVYTPSLDRTSRLALPCCYRRGTNRLREAFLVEGFFFLVRTSLVADLYPLPEWNKYGWGVDHMTAYKAYAAGLRAVVDDQVIMHHPASIHSHYIDKQQAESDGRQYTSGECDSFVQWCFRQIAFQDK